MHVPVIQRAHWPAGCFVYVCWPRLGCTNFTVILFYMIIFHHSEVGFIRIESTSVFTYTYETSSHCTRICESSATRQRERAQNSWHKRERGRKGVGVGWLKIISAYTTALFNTHMDSESEIRQLHICLCNRQSKHYVNISCDDGRSRKQPSHQTSQTAYEVCVCMWSA